MIGNEHISVIVPAVNSQRTITQCLDSLRGQTIKPLEIIVVDDGSTDQTVALVKKKAVVVNNTRTPGPAGSRNSGAFAARGQILAFTDSDCLVPSDWLAKIAQGLSNPLVGAVGGGYRQGADNSFWQRFCCEELRFRRRNWHGSVRTLVSNNFATLKSIFMEQGGFPEQYPVCEDMLLSYKISQKKKVIWLSDNGLTHHFKNSLKQYLCHQYFFGAESTRFFLLNPQVALHSNHQGRRLHLAIISGLAFVLSVLFWTGFTFSGNLPAAGIFLGIALFLLIGHLGLYLGFMRYLAKVKFGNIAAAYAVSLLRDLICAVSIIKGIALTFLNRRKR